MMLGMTKRIDRHEPQITDDDFFRILRHLELILFNWQKLTPEFIHPFSVNARGAGDELFGVQQMRRTIRVDVNLRALPRKPARRTSMVEVNVREQHVGNASER